MNDSNKPLWLPVGSVRAIIALMTMGTLCYAFLKQAEVPDRLFELGLLVAGAYFIQKVVQAVKK